MTRWHGTRRATRLARQAAPTARAAPGAPTAMATRPYEVNDPRGTSSSARQTARWKGVPLTDTETLVTGFLSPRPNDLPNRPPILGHPSHYWVFDDPATVRGEDPTKSLQIPTETPTSNSRPDNSSPRRLSPTTTTVRRQYLREHGNTLHLFGTHTGTHTGTRIGTRISIRIGWDHQPLLESSDIPPRQNGETSVAPSALEIIERTSGPSPSVISSGRWPSPS